MNNSDQFYLTLPSDSSRSFFPSNTLSKFSTKLAQTIELQGDWCVGLCEISYPYGDGSLIETDVEKVSSNTESVFIYSDIVTPQFVGDSYVRSLRVIQFPSLRGQHFFQPVYYLPVEKKNIESITIALVNKHGENVKFNLSSLSTNIVLHFMKVKLI